jgi:hypothetical protein
MTRNAAPLALAAALALVATPGSAANQRGAELNVLVDGYPRPEYVGRGTVYVEALKGREYSLEIRNPYPYRVAVALSVDGLNTIDARHTDPWSARKWVLEPYGSAVIEGWQVSDSAARRFYFTNERGSYGAWLGQTQNLGVIEAVFFRERAPRPIYRHDRWDDPNPAEDRGYDPRRPAAEKDDSAAGAPAPAPEPKLKAEGRRQESGERSSQPADEYAATGMGGRTRHDVYRVDLDLERSPVATLKVRYEYRNQLTRMGLLPRYYEEDPRPLTRRERARGFEGSYAPEPRRGW